MKTRKIIELYVLANSSDEQNAVVDIINCLNENNIEIGICPLGSPFNYKCKYIFSKKINL